MITIVPSEGADAFKAFNSAGSVIEGHLTLNQMGSGELRFQPTTGYDQDHYEEFLKEDRKVEVAKRG